MPIGDNRNLVTDTNGSITDVIGVGPVPEQVPNVVQSTAQNLATWAAAPGEVFAGQQPQTPGMWSDVDEAIRQANLSGQYEWGPETAMGMVGAPGLTGGVPGLGSGVQRSLMFSEGGATVHKLQKPGRWPKFVATSPSGEAQEFKDFEKAKQWAAPPEAQRPDPPASPMELPPWEDPIRAFHGSPHDFPAFDISKVGTGQGAQSYGHGLYFAEEPKVAQGYREQLTGRGGVNPNAMSAPTRWLVNGEPAPASISGHMSIDTAGDIDRYLYYVKSKSDPGVQQVIKENLERRIDKFRREDKTGWHPGIAGDDMRALADYYDKHVRNIKPEQISEKPPGRMYEVNIKADPEHFLDWDKPLSEQPRLIKNAPQLLEVAKQEAYRRALSATDKVRADQLWEMVKDPTKAPAEFAFRAFEQQPKETFSVRGSAQEPWQASGKNTFEEALASVGGDKSRVLTVHTSDRAAASDALRQAGIPGIRYLDQGSRKGTVGGQVRPMKWGEGGTNFREGRFGVYLGDKLVAAFDSRREAEAATKGTYNYVVFDDKLIDIVKKYGLAGLIAGGASNWSPDQAKAMDSAAIANMRRSKNIEDIRKGMDEQGMQDENARHEAEMIQQQNANFETAKSKLKLTPQEEFLYQRHLDVLREGGVENPKEGGISTLFQTSAEHNGRFYNIPTLWDGQFLDEDQAAERAGQVGWDKWPSYSTREKAEQRYKKMHDYMEGDLKSYGK